MTYRKQEGQRGSEIKSELDRKKERQRNLVPAKTGFLIIIMVFCNTFIYYASYGLTSSMTSLKLDVNTRSYFLTFTNDLYPCFISPLVVVFEAPVIRRKINKTFSWLKNYLYGLFLPSSRQ